MTLEQTYSEIETNGENKEVLDFIYRTKSDTLNKRSSTEFVIIILN